VTMPSTLERASELLSTCKQVIVCGEA
jgi:hypothetical protein